MFGCLDLDASGVNFSRAVMLAEDSDCAIVQPMAAGDFNIARSIAIMQLRTDSC